MKLDGKALSQKLLDQLKPRVEKLAQKGVVPTMLVVLVGNNEESNTYVRQKGLKALEIGARTEVLTFDDSMTYEQAKKLIEKYNADPSVHGIIIQRPAPEQLKVDELCELIDPVKEVDGFGKDSVYDIPVAKATLAMIEDAFDQMANGQKFEDFLKNQKVVVIGKGQTAGKPIIDLLKKYEVDAQIIDRKTPNPKDVSKTADILISAVGKDKTVTADMLKKGVILIGVGIHIDNEGKVRGDYHRDEIADIVSYYSPTPGGIGPMNVACLMQNLVKAAENTTPRF